MDAGQWDEHYAAKDTLWGEEPNRFVRAQCEDLPVGVALDLACGEGRNAVWLACLGWTVTGVDFSPLAIDRAHAVTARQQAEVAARLTWRVADVTVFELVPNTVDLVVVSYVHIRPDERDALFSRSASALRSGGHLVIVGHDKRNLGEGVSGPQDPDLLYEPSQVRRLLSANGLVVERADTVERPTPDGVALDTLVRARQP